MNAADFIRHLGGLDGVESAENFGYTMFFVGPDRKLPFATLAESDNAYDDVSKLDRPGVFRLNLGVSKATFESLFGSPSSLEGVDFTELDRILPHPHYATQHYLCVLNPDRTLPMVLDLLAEAHAIAARRAGKPAGEDVG